MKKILTLLLIVVLSFSIVGCGETETPEKTNLTRADLGLAYVMLDKAIYSSDDTINVSIYNSVETDYVAVFDIEGEPGKHKPYKKVKVGSELSLSFSISDLGLEVGKEYVVCIYQNKTFRSFDRVEFLIYSFIIK